MREQLKDEMEQPLYTLRIVRFRRTRRLQQMPYEHLPRRERYQHVPFRSLLDNELRRQWTIVPSIHIF